jgi:hypothetical protein
VNAAEFLFGIVRKGRERVLAMASFPSPPLGGIKFYLKIGLFCYSSPSNQFSDQFSIETVLNLRVHG